MKGPIVLPVIPTVSLSKQAAICAQQCQARCCRYIIVKIPAPRTRIDHEEIRWWVAHDGIRVHIDQRKWYLQIFTPCAYMKSSNLCGVYDKRPEVCSDHDPDDCEFTGEMMYDREFTSMEEYDRYLEERRFQRRNGKRELKTDEGRRRR